MKRQQQSTDISSQVTEDVSHYSYLKKVLEEKAERLRKNALIDAQTLSQREYRLRLPELQIRVEELRQEYRQLRVEVDLALNPKSQGILGNHEAKEFTQQLNELALKLGDIRKEIEAHAAQKLERPTPLSGYEKAVLVAPFILLGLDVLFEAPALRILGSSGLLAYTTALLLNGGKYAFSKFLNRRIRVATTQRGRTMWFVTGAVTFGMIALILGISRHAYLEMQDGGSVYGPVILTVLSFFVSMTAWIAEWFAEETRQKKTRITEEDKVFVEFDRLEGQKVEIENAIGHIKRERSGQLGGRLVSMDNARSLEQYLEDHYKGTVNKFQTEYHARRTDHREHGDGVFITTIPPLSDDSKAEYYNLNSRPS